DVDWNGAKVPEGTQVLIVNSFNHRDNDAVPFADRFDPEQWLSGDAGADWLFNHFSHGPQGCPGTSLAMLVGKAVVGTLLRERSLRLLSPSLNPDRPLPHALDHFGLRFSLGGPAAAS